jgi:hypothetical protein
LAGWGYFHPAEVTARPGRLSSHIHRRIGDPATSIGFIATPRGHAGHSRYPPYRSGPGRLTLTGAPPVREISHTDLVYGREEPAGTPRPRGSEGPRIPAGLRQGRSDVGGVLRNQATGTLISAATRVGAETTRPPGGRPRGRLPGQVPDMFGSAVAAVVLVTSLSPRAALRTGRQRTGPAPVSRPGQVQGNFQVFTGPPAVGRPGDRRQSTMSERTVVASALLMSVSKNARLRATRSLGHVHHCASTSTATTSGAARIFSTRAGVPARTA